MQQIGKRAQRAGFEVSQLSTPDKNRILLGMAAALDENRADLLAANAKDMAAAEQAGTSGALLDRLALSNARIDDMIAGIRTVEQLPDPVGTVIDEFTLDNGLNIQKTRVPIGVIGIIYESRPNVTSDVTALCLKAGNTVILRGSSMAIHSNQAIVEAMNKAGYPANAVQLIDRTDHACVTELVKMDEYVDLIIPRGGKGLIQAVLENARVPVVRHDDGICHTFVDESADLNKAIAICENAKVQRPGVCNAMETLLVHQAIAKDFLPQLAKQLPQVELRGDKQTQAILPNCKPATEEDWSTEYLDLILSIKIVNNTDAAIQHINHYGSHHSDAIISENKTHIEKFLNQVDSATVYANASTRFTDGGQFGMGAEIGISTGKLHARGPMGLQELTTYKYIIHGQGQTRD